MHFFINMGSRRTYGGSHRVNSERIKSYSREQNCFLKYRHRHTQTQTHTEHCPEKRPH